ncbi:MULTISPECIES: DUF6877 family protein [Lactiplantibacillus]|uniref:DUF6877 family protein n=1 Tax=Lactiplantibacillus TaxID=2767842 RepID=UPI000BB07E0F|nr:DUF6877 family protein [Lactiplantibacillus plantarum]ASZ34676.1 hypothetical protein CLC99_16000 [Lactiplantibacillus plantarum]
MLPIEIIESLAPKLPFELLTDLNQRMMGWKASGGNDTDAYMYQQSRAAENYYRLVLKIDPMAYEDK